MEEVFRERQRDTTCAGRDPEGASSLAGSQWSDDITSGPEEPIHWKTPDTGEGR